MNKHEKKVKMIKRLLILTIGLFCTLQTYSQKGQVIERTNQIYDSLILLRRNLHRNPELSGQEIKTAKTIENYLISLGLEVYTGIGGHSVVGILKGANRGRTLAWRADIDAFKTEFQDVVDFKSENQGVRHICGHDVHTTIGLGIANVLTSLKDKFDGNVMFIFQPSEENFKGAKSMIDSGLFDILKPDAIFALHIAPIPTGVISCKTHEMYWRGKVLSIEITGQDNIEKLTNDLTSILLTASSEKEDSPFFSPHSLMSEQNNPGNPNTIYKDYFAISKNRIKQEKIEDGIIINVEVESSNQDNLITGLEKIKSMIKQSEYADRVGKIQYTQDYPTVFNSPELTSSSIKIITDNFGNEIFAQLYGVSRFNNDDFAYFQQEIDGVYFFLGASDFQSGIISAPHSPNFNIDEKAVKNGINYFSTLILGQLNEMNKNAP